MDGVVASGVCSSSRRDDFVEKGRLEALRAAIEGLPFLRHLLQIPNGRRAVLTVAMVVLSYGLSCGLRFSTASELNFLSLVPITTPSSITTHNMASSTCALPLRCRWIRPAANWSQKCIKEVQFTTSFNRHHF